jgi:hypothetical protein
MRRLLFMLLAVALSTTPVSAQDDPNDVTSGRAASTGPLDSGPFDRFTRRDLCRYQRVDARGQ